MPFRFAGAAIYSIAFERDRHAVDGAAAAGRDDAAVRRCRRAQRDGVAPRHSGPVSVLPSLPELATLVELFVSMPKCCARLRALPRIDLVAFASSVDA